MTSRGIEKGTGYREGWVIEGTISKNINWRGIEKGLSQQEVQVFEGFELSIGHKIYNVPIIF